MTKTLQLAKGYNLAKLSDFVYVSEKLDGVPARFYMQVGPLGDVAHWVHVRSRQNEELLSCQSIARELANRLTAWLVGLPADKKAKWASAEITLIGEVTHEEYTDFKDVSGVVRRQSLQDGLRVGLFDLWSNVLASEHQSFMHRHTLMSIIFKGRWARSYVIPQTRMPKAAAHAFCDLFIEDNPKAEGLIIRSATEAFQPGKRTWGYQKYVIDPTIDLFIVGVEEATSEDGRPLNMAGRLVASYKGREIGIGPGKLSHDERRELFQEFYQWQQAIASGYKDTKWRRMAAIKYKRDDSYTDLRQPTFQAWRDDKDTPDA